MEANVYKYICETIIYQIPGIQTLLLGDRNFYLHHLGDPLVVNVLAGESRSTGRRYPLPFEKVAKLEQFVTFYNF